MACVGLGPSNRPEVPPFASSDCGQEPSAHPPVHGAGPSHMPTGVKTHALGDESGGASLPVLSLRMGYLGLPLIASLPRNHASHSRIYPPQLTSLCLPARTSFRVKSTLGLKQSLQKRTRPG